MTVKLSARTLRVALCCALLALVTAVTAVRAARLAGGEALGARGERQWHGWAYRHPELAAQLGRARAELRPGETVHLVVPPGRYEARWLRVMARYHLPEQALGGIHERGAAPFPPAEATTVALARNGEVWVRRGAGEREAGAPGRPFGSGRADMRKRAAESDQGPEWGSTPGIGHAGEGWVAEVGLILLGALAAAAVGLAALPLAARTAAAGGRRPAPRLRPGPWLARAPLAGIAGLALLTPLLYLLWRLRLPPAPAVVLGAAALSGASAVLAGAFRRSRAARCGAAAAGPRSAPREGVSRPPQPGLAPTEAPRSGPGEAIDPPRAGGPRPALRGPASALRWLPWLPAAAALGAFLWKMTRVPVWSWDHYAIWGVKARRIFLSGAFDPAWATPDGVARPDYPLGLPLAWRALTLGAEPGPAAFVAAHALMAVALVALAGRAAARLSGARLAGGAAAALVAASPLLWDTESLGLADLPLALWAVGAVAVVAAHASPGGGGGPSGDPALPARSPAAARPPLWVAGLCLGFLPWLKTEGLPLAVGLLAAAVAVLHLGRPRAGGDAGGRTAGGRTAADRLAADRAGAVPAPGGRRAAALRRGLALALPALLLGAGGLAATPGAGDRDLGFFRGDWAGRGLARLPEAPRLARALAADLAGPEWLGIWWLFAAAALAAVALAVRRRPDAAAAAAAALALTAVVGLQFALYFATYLVSYIPAEQHAATSFHRVAAALAPLALLAGAAALGGARPARSP